MLKIVIFFCNIQLANRNRMLNYKKLILIFECLFLLILDEYLEYPVPFKRTEQNRRFSEANHVSVILRIG